MNEYDLSDAITETVAGHWTKLSSKMALSVCATTVDSNSGVYVYYLKGIVSVCLRCPARTVGFSWNTPVLVHLQPTKLSDALALPTPWLGRSTRGLQPGGDGHEQGTCSKNLYLLSPAVSVSVPLCWSCFSGMECHIQKAIYWLILRCHLQQHTNSTQNSWKNSFQVG